MLAHEIAHSWEAMHENDYLARTGDHYRKERWSHEGMAEALGLEVLPRRLGRGLLADADAGAWYDANARDRLLQEYRATTGDMENGYQHVAGFLRDLATRLVTDGGLPADDAWKEVIGGSLDGMYGCTATTCRDGLQARMRARLGEDWTPVDGLLTYGASFALDGRGIDGFEDRAVDWSVRGGSLRTWAPLAVATTGTGVTARAGAAPVGSVGWVQVEDALGGTVLLEGDVPLEVLVVRGQ